MATHVELELLGFRSHSVKAKTLNIQHPGADARGPFCRLDVDGEVPLSPGVYAWVCDDNVMYVGKAIELRQIVHGVRMNRAFNDYTYIPASKLRQLSSPRVRVNGLLNGVICGGSTVGWWWLATDTGDGAERLEAKLISDWRPPWNRALPFDPGGLPEEA